MWEIIGRNIDEEINNYKLIELEHNFCSLSDIWDDFKARFVSNSFIYQSLINENWKTNPDDVTVCTTSLTVLDPTTINPFDVPTPTTKTYLQLPISNGEFHYMILEVEPLLLMVNIWF